MTMHLVGITAIHNAVMAPKPLTKVAAAQILQIAADNHPPPVVLPPTLQAKAAVPLPSTPTAAPPSVPIHAAIGGVLGGGAGFAIAGPVGAAVGTPAGGLLGALVAKIRQAL